MKLEKLQNFNKRKGPVVVIVLDGVGIGRHDNGDAVFQAHPQHYNKYIEAAKAQNLYAELRAHGPAVGLPSIEDMGNSEVGHNALGAGQIVSQGAKRVNEAIENGDIFKSPSWKSIVEDTAKAGKALHFFGLLSDGNVHSNVTQLFKILDGAKNSGAKKIRIHPLLDGRDVAPDSGLIYIGQLEEKLAELRKAGVDAVIASGGGRMHVTMDRYNSDWKIVERGFNAMTHGKVVEGDLVNGYKGYYTSAKDAIEEARKLFPEKQDQFNPTFVIVDSKGQPLGKMEEGDAVINFNYRGDRAIQISQAYIQADFKAFPRGTMPKVKYAGLLEYDSDAKIPPQYLVSPPSIKNVSGQLLCEAGIKSYAIAETHKYGHVTYFWNGNRSGYINDSLETFEEVKSLPNETIADIPEMKIYEVTEKLLEAIHSDKYDFIRVNFANGDMVGHTGNIQSCIKAMKAVDECLFRTVEAALHKNGVVLVTADHGNAEEKLDKKGKVVTSHTLNKVPMFIIDKEYKGEYVVNTQGIADPGITNVTATFLNLLGFKAPDIYEKSLIQFK